jgi:hypothetical protein
MTNSSTHSPETMTARQSRFVRPRRLFAGAAALSLLILGSCSTSDILEVNDPDLLPPDGLNTPAGADPLRFGVIRDFVSAFDGGGDSFAVVTGNLADEIRASDTFDGRLLPNKRSMNDNLPEMAGVYRNLHKARAGATTAIKIISQTTGAWALTPTPKFNIGEVYMYRAYTEDFFAEMYCSGVPFSEAIGDEVVYGQPQTTTEILNRSIASFDSALSLADTSKRVRFGASIGKARALLNLERFAEAADAVKDVPTTFKLLSDHCRGSGCTENGVYTATAPTSSRYYAMTNEGQNGLPFLQTPADPRMPWQASSSRAGFNSAFTGLPIQLKALRDGPNTLADGIEARLIEAEATLQTNSQGARDAVFETLNGLRATGIPGKVITALPGSAPTTQDAAITQLFTERAYWMWLTGHRLGDLRRLVRQYGRDAESVYPTGEQSAPLSGPYGTDVVFPIPAQEKNNPNFTGCLDRKA